MNQTEVKYSTVLPDESCVFRFKKIMRHNQSHPAFLPSPETNLTPHAQLPLHKHELWKRKL